MKLLIIIIYVNLSKYFKVSFAKVDTMATILSVALIKISLSTPFNFKKHIYKMKKQG